MFGLLLCGFKAQCMHLEYSLLIIQFVEKHKNTMHSELNLQCEFSFLQTEGGDVIYYGKLIIACGLSRFILCCVIDGFSFLFE